MPAKLICVIFFLSLAFCGSTQTLHLSPQEKCWALFHPFAAIKIKKINSRASLLYQPQLLQMQLDAYSNGGKLDAFRHSFYMAAFAQKIKIKKLRKLGIAHEKANYRQFQKSRTEEGEIPDSLSSVMDLQNNELGFVTGATHKKDELETLKNILIEKINAGAAVIMKRNNDGAYLDCKGHLLPTGLRTWNLPKCLVASAPVKKE